MFPSFQIYLFFVKKGQQKINEYVNHLKRIDRFLEQKRKLLLKSQNICIFIFHTIEAHRSALLQAQRYLMINSTKITREIVLYISNRKKETMLCAANCQLFSGELFRIQRSAQNALCSDWNHCGSGHIASSKGSFTIDVLWSPYKNI